MKPTVCAIILTKDRPAMLRRALRSFDAQQYEGDRFAIVVDSQRPADPIGTCSIVRDFSTASTTYGVPAANMTIGALRNYAIERAPLADIIVHFDDDDWSHPNRIAEQVELLQSSGADIVGYSDLLFWENKKQLVGGGLYRDEVAYSTAWLYRAGRPGYTPGTAMCYWRRVWEAQPFLDVPRVKEDGTTDDGAEDLHFQDGRKVIAVASVGLPSQGNGYPRMIANVHGGNTLSRIAKGAREWLRAPEWDAYCRERMVL